MKIAIVGCGKQKDPRLEAMPARERYTSPLFRKSLELAERTSDHVYVASAMLGLITLHCAVAYYEESLTDRTRVYREEWGVAVVRQLRAWHEDLVDANGPGSSPVCIYAGAVYADPIKRALALARIPSATPLGNLTIGPRLAELNRRLAETRCAP